MNKDLYAQQILDEAKRQGFSREQATQCLADALREFDSKQQQSQQPQVQPQPQNMAQQIMGGAKKVAGGAGKVVESFYPDTTKTVKGVATGKIPIGSPEFYDPTKKTTGTTRAVGEVLGVLPGMTGSKDILTSEGALPSAGREIALDIVFDKLFNLAGDPTKKLLSKVTSAIGDTAAVKGAKGAVQGVKRAMASQILQPSQGQIVKGIKESFKEMAKRTGINETLEYIAKNGLELNPKKLFQRSGTILSSLVDDTKKLSKQFTKELPPIDFNDITSVLDDEITQATRLKDAKTIKTLLKLKSDFGEGVELLTAKAGKASDEVFKGSKKPNMKNFDETYQLLKDFGDKARKAYEQGKTPSGTKEIKTRAYQLMNNKGRALLSKTADDAGYPVWKEMMNDYHHWKIIESWSKDALAKGQGKIGSITNVIFSRMLPALISGGPITKGIAGGAFGYTLAPPGADRQKWAIGAGAGTATAASLPRIFGAAGTSKVGAGVSKAVKTLAPKTTRRVIQDYLMPQEDEEDEL